MKIFVTLIAIMLLVACSSNDKVVKVFPVYGNYCGTANPRISQKLDPINITDFLCEERLDCRKRNGRSKYGACDRLLVTEIEKLKSASGDERTMQRYIIYYFKNR